MTPDIPRYVKENAVAETVTLKWETARGAALVNGEASGARLVVESTAHTSQLRNKEEVVQKVRDYLGVGYPMPSRFSPRVSALYDGYASAIAAAVEGKEQGEAWSVARRMLDDLHRDVERVGQERDGR